MATGNPAITPEEILAHSDWLRRLARRLVSHDDGADDLVQDTWTAALRMPPQRDRPIRPWLAEVLRNFARKRGRGGAHRAERERVYVDAVHEPLPTAEQLLARQEAMRVVAE